MGSVDLQFLLNLACAVFLGSAIGLERQWRQRRAGLRTNALVAVGAALFVMATDAVGNTGDHARIAAQVVSGIGFLGAGVIMRDGLSVRGLNTAATLWGSGAIGVLCGYGLNAKGAVGTFVIVFANVLLRRLAQRINREPAPSEDNEFHYRVIIECKPSDESQVRYLLLQNVAVGPLVLNSINSEDEAEGKVRVSASLSSFEKANSLVEQAVSRLSVEPGVTLVSWKLTTDEQNI